MLFNTDTYWTPRRNQDAETPKDGMGLFNLIELAERFEHRLLATTERNSAAPAGVEVSCLCPFEEQFGVGTSLVQAELVRGSS